eukprot:m.51615 g.51615  ORF g.51615 m.51615 type:complete len:697 (+) comp10743_c0_seq3:181-2271(+)
MLSTRMLRLGASRNHVLQRCRTANILARAQTTSSRMCARDYKRVHPQQTGRRMYSAESFEFQAETRKLLDIVATSLYSDKEVFVREIVSNASDALEKRRYQQLSSEESSSDEKEQIVEVVEGEDDSESKEEEELPALRISITVDEEKKTFSIEDTGIGMNRDEMINNLGTIARSGSKEFVSNLDNAAASSNIIGQFGVGFYSTFMVGSNVTVFSKSANGDTAHKWESDGTGKYTIEESTYDTIGTKIVINLNDTGMPFASKDTVQDCLEKHSNFVSFPIFLNGERINTIEALWTKSKNSVSEEEHAKFYRFVAGAWDTPRYTLHYSVDAPLQLRALLYIPTYQPEKMGFGRQEPGVSLYSRKVLILDKAPKLLPEWLRFMKGVVDSEDIPLNLSRELLQDSSLINRIKDVLSGYIIRYLQTESRKDEEKFLEFYKEYGTFLREGACTDRSNQEKIMQLMRYESSTQQAKEFTTLDEYVSRLPESQMAIYYICAKDRKQAESSPYTEAFISQGKEVIFSYEPLDEVVFTNVHKYKGKEFISVETNKVELDVKTSENELNAEQQTELSAWLSQTLGDKVSTLKASKRLVSHPAIISDETGRGAMRRVQRMLEDMDGESKIPAQELEVNYSHPIMIKLHECREKDPVRANLVAEQIFDNALVHAGLMDDSRFMIGRVNKLMEMLLEVEENKSDKPADDK